MGGKNAKNGSSVPIHLNSVHGHPPCDGVNFTLFT